MSEDWNAAEKILREAIPDLTEILNLYLSDHRNCNNIERLTRVIRRVEPNFLQPKS